MLLLTSCGTGEDRTRIVFFDVEGLIKQQVSLLTHYNPSYKKVASINGNEESITGRLDSLGWKRELDLFLQADINKPALFDSYSTNEFQNGNTKVIEYNAIDPKDVGVEYLAVRYEGQRLLSMEMLFTEKNMLYITKRKLQMFFDEGENGLPLAKSFTIDGKQKMIFKDSIVYRIETGIFY